MTVLEWIAVICFMVYAICGAVVIYLAATAPPIMCSKCGWEYCSCKKEDNQ